MGKALTSLYRPKVLAIAAAIGLGGAFAVSDQSQLSLATPRVVRRAPVDDPLIKPHSTRRLRPRAAPDAAPSPQKPNRLAARAIAEAIPLASRPAAPQDARTANVAPFVRRKPPAAARPGEAAGQPAVVPPPYRERLARLEEEHEFQVLRQAAPARSESVIRQAVVETRDPAELRRATLVQHKASPRSPGTKSSAVWLSGAIEVE